MNHMTRNRVLKAALFSLSCVIFNGVQAKQLLPANAEIFTVAGKTAFLALPEKTTVGKQIPWLWSVPVDGNLPGQLEKWMLDKCLANGIAVGGIDLSGNLGTPQGRAILTAFYEEVTTHRGLTKKACLLARSYGGLQMYNWAAEHPESVAGLAGIYPVCNMASWPGLKRASDAYGMTEEELTRVLKAHNPIDRLAPLAKANIPIHHIHGDVDKLVPLAKHSALLAERYRGLGGAITVDIRKGQGHNYWRGFFESEAMADFIIENANKAQDMVIKMPGAGEMRFRLLPAGRFMMGSPQDAQDSDKDEKPLHEVVISKPFCLGVFEVTCAQWKLVMGTLPKDAGDDPGAAVSGVTWQECQTFIGKLEERGFGTFGLPTEAQWEYACRAGTGSRFYWGDDPDFAEADNYAWHQANADGRARPVGQKKPNAWGLYDMSGNAWEWCSDWYGPYLPGRQVDPKGPREGKSHVMRGNGWRWGPKYCRSANRFYSAKGHATGLRLVLVQKGLTSASETIKVTNLGCEYQIDPWGIDIVQPRLSWKLESTQRRQKQTAFRLLVASSRDKLERNIGDLWESGKVKSDQSIHIAYGGKGLASRMQCFWKVMVWDKDGKPSNWSEPGIWTMGLLNKTDWKAKWIGTPQPQTSPFYRQSFQIDDIPERAVVYVAPLGYFELFVNGQKIADEVLAPAVSNFSKRSYYRTYDVADHLKKGNNSLAIWMGTGWYSPGLPGVKHHSPVVRAQLELSGNGKEQCIITDKSWQTKPSERKLLGQWRWGKFGGEQVDRRHVDKQWYDTQKSTSGWTPVVEVDPADVPCSAQPCAGNHKLAAIPPRSVEKLDEDTVLVDFGTNLTGFMNMTFRGLQSGQKVTMYYADLDGRQEEDKWRAKQTHKDFAVYGQYDEFISAGAPEEQFSNLFNYHAFRYVLIEGLSYLPNKADMAAVPVETGVGETGTFSCSNELYNRIDKMVRWTYRCLNLGGQTVDCPHRERLGYGDGQTIMDTGCFNFDAASMYAKWSRNWWDEQKEDGFVPFTAPCPHGSGGGPAWGAMCIMVPWKTYLFSRDHRLLEEGYPYMKKYMDYLDAHCQEGVLQDIFPGQKWPNLGDWVPPRRGMDKQNWVDDSSRRFFNNCYRVHLLQIMQQIAGALGKDDDVKAFEQEMSVAQKKVHDAWFNSNENTYANGEQPYLIFPLKTGITPNALKDIVFEKYIKTLQTQDKGHLNSGMIGTQIMVDYLLEIDRNDLVDTFVNKKTYPGWGYMVEQGATTCWEQWNGYFSQIHSCFPYIGGWFYRGLAGIRWDPAAPGFKHVILRPGRVESVDWVKCSYESP
ncbi:MAG: family 78 glycoside hydrolase catalytic domain, partial [Phycisphaerae bacterium]|nr:family 78 glycoside hydrolase catalytic domain [Phycisphaerae bacterium]